MILQQLIPRQIFLFMLFFVLLITALLFQTTLWFDFLGYFPSPNLWIPIFVYLMLNREPKKRLLWFVFIYLLLLTCTVSLPTQLLIALTGTSLIIHFIQSRFSTLSIFDLVVFSSGAIFTLPLLYALIDLMISSRWHYDWIFHIANLLFSIPFIPGVLLICRKIDKTFDPHNTLDNLVLEL